MRSQADRSYSRPTSDLGARKADHLDLCEGDVGANALCVHLNPAMELIQTDGDRDFRGCVQTLRRLCDELPFPIIAKETGNGLSPQTVEKLVRAGVRYVDTSDGARVYLDGVAHELHSVMLLTGTRTVDGLRHAPRIISGELEKWIVAVQVNA